MDRLQGAYAKKARINAAPPVPVREVEGDLTLHGATAVYHNPRYSALAAVSQGPAQPLAGLTRVAAGANTPSGALEGHAMDSRAHQEQVNLSLRTGHAHDPDSGALVALHGDGSVFPPVAPARPAAKRAKGPDAADDAWLGPWAAHDAPVPGQLTLEQLEAIQRQYEAAQNNNAAEPAQNNIAAEDAEGPEVADPEAAETGVAGVAPARAAQRSRREAPGPTPSSRLLVSGAPDYLGRLWTHASGARGQTPAQCFAPRKRVAQCSTSSAAKGVTRLRWLPDTAHLLLSAAQDGCCRVWGWPNKKELAQYWGHDKGCKDACFTPDGLQFVSVGFDRRVVLWDVASARAPLTVSVPHMAYCCAVTARGDSVLVGCHDNHIYQYDLRSGALQQDYDRHLGPVNSVTLIEGGARFVSTSDDKTVRYWETGIGVDIKTHQEPHMHSMPCVALHPGGAMGAFQSMDNQILLYGVENGNYKLNRSKRYVGHLVAGYACGLDFSPDGAYIVSGDSEGKLFFWDYVSGKCVRKLVGTHKGPVAAVAWHPHEPSAVVSGGWDGKIIVSN